MFQQVVSIGKKCLMTGESYREGGLVESLRGARGKPGPEVVTVEAEHGEEGNLVLKTLSLHQKHYPCSYRDRDPVDGDDEDAVCPGGQAAAHGAGAQGHRSSI